MGGYDNLFVGVEVSVCTCLGFVAKSHLKFGRIKFGRDRKKQNSEEIGREKNSEEKKIRVRE